MVHDERGRARRSDRRRLRTGGGRRPAGAARPRHPRGCDARGLGRPAVLRPAPRRDRAGSTSTYRAPGTPATSATRSGSTPGRPRRSGTRCGRPASPTASARPASARSTSPASRPGLILIEADYTSARHAISPEQHYSPFEIGLGGFVDLSKAAFVGKHALELEQGGGGPGRRLVGLDLEWLGIEAMFARHDLPPMVSALVHRDPVPVYKDGRQVGRATSVTWGPTIKKMVGFGSLPPALAEPGTPGLGRVERRGRARQGGGDRRASAVPRPPSQARVGEPRGPRGRTRSGMIRPPMGSRRVLVLLAVTGGVVAFVLVATGSLIAGALAGLLVFGACLFAIRARVPEDPDRRRLLVAMGGLGLAAVALGTAAGALVRRLTRPDPRPALEAMSSDLGLRVPRAGDPHLQRRAPRRPPAARHALLELELPAGVALARAQRPALEPRRHLDVRRTRPDRRLVAGPGSSRRTTPSGSRWPISRPRPHG